VAADAVRGNNSIVTGIVAMVIWMTVARTSPIGAIVGQPGRYRNAPASGSSAAAR